MDFKRWVEAQKVPHLVLLYGRGRKELEAAADELASLMTSGPDRFEYRPEGKLAMHTVGSMEELQKEAALPPYLHAAKVFIIYDVDRLHPHASHALLKLFEEPPKGIHFILTSLNKEKILPTILSRAQSFSIPGKEEEKPLSPETEAFLSIGKYQDSRPFFAGIKKIAETYTEIEDPLVLQSQAEKLWQDLEARHPGKGPFFDEARFKLSRSCSLESILESLFIKLGYL